MVEQGRTMILFLFGLTPRCAQIFPHRCCFQPVRRFRQRCPFVCATTGHALARWIVLGEHAFGDCILVRLTVRLSAGPHSGCRATFPDEFSSTGKTSINGRTNRRTIVRDALRLTITERHCMPNPSLPSHLLDWLWIGLSTGPNGAAAEMIPSSITASAYWRGWTLKAWRYFLSRLLQGVRKGSVPGNHAGVVSFPVWPEPLSLFKGSTCYVGSRAS